MNRINYEKGEKIGRFVYLEEAEGGKWGRQGIFMCHCGKEFIAFIGAVKKEAIAGCKECCMILPGKHVNGTYFIEERGHRGKRRIGLFECKYCRNHFETDIQNIQSGNTTSCGCYQAYIRAKSHTIHGHSKRNKKSAEYKVWVSIRERCNCETNRNYHRYGGRGIKMCERWSNKENGFLNFLSDMGERPSKNHTIERNEVNGNYEPNNCCWIPKPDQAKNRRSTIWIEINGVQLCLTDWCKKIGTKRGGVYDRIRKNNKNDATRIFLEFISEKGIKVPAIIFILIISIMFYK